VGSGSTGGGSSSAIDVAQTPLTADQNEQYFTSAVVGLNLSLEATGGQVRVTRIDVATSGTIDETLLGGAQLVEDLNGNGEVDAGETAAADAPAVLADDGTYALAPLTPLVLVPGTPRTFLLTVDASGVAPADQAANVGQTLVANLDALGVVAEDDQGLIVNANGTFPLSSSVTFEVGDTALLSEVVVGPGTGASSAEYVEVFNATGRPIDLSNYYMTDATNDPSIGQFYWKLPSGQDFANTSTADWFVRFPAGATLTPGQVITVAIDGEGFKAAYAADADYCMRNAGTTTSAQMLTWDGVAPGTNFVAAPVSSSAGLTNGGEFVCLFVWDGSADLVQDVDLLNYGNASFSNTSVNKSPGQGTPDVKVDSLTDADAVESTFQDDSSDLFQLDHRGPGSSGAPALKRVDFTEGAEAKTGGNGITGHDETSEDFGDGAGNPGTFAADASPTPGVVN
jgi:hypothetical protein